MHVAAWSCGMLIWSPEICNVVNILFKSWSRVSWNLGFCTWDLWFSKRCEPCVEASQCSSRLQLLPKLPFWCRYAPGSGSGSPLDSRVASSSLWQEHCELYIFAKTATATALKKKIQLDLQFFDLTRCPCKSKEYVVKFRQGVVVSVSPPMSSPWAKSGPQLRQAGTPSAEPAQCLALWCQGAGCFRTL